LKQSRRRVRLGDEEAAEEVIVKPLAPALQKSNQPAAFIAPDKRDQAVKAEAQNRATETVTTTVAQPPKPLGVRHEVAVEKSTDASRPGEEKPLASRLLDARRKKRE
jgi:hypothetical protein